MSNSVSIYERVQPTNVKPHYDTIDMNRCPVSKPEQPYTYAPAYGVSTYSEIGPPRPGGQLTRAAGNVAQSPTYDKIRDDGSRSHFSLPSSQMSYEAASKQSARRSIDGGTEPRQTGGRPRMVDRSFSWREPSTQLPLSPYCPSYESPLERPAARQHADQPSLPPPPPRPRNDRSFSRRKLPPPPPVNQSASYEHLLVEEGNAGQDVAETAPPNSAVVGLSVDDVADCLRQMHLDAFVDAFHEHGVDGHLLANIDEQMLISNFAMSRFEATKFIMFVKQGWRPKNAYDG